MNMRRIFLKLITTIMIMAAAFGLISTAYAEDPYSYSGEPTRAIYYVIPTMRGNDVKWVQAALNAYGNYGLAIDGSFGPACKEATAKFQASMGLAQDGSFGPATRAKMVEWLNSRNQSQSQPAPQPSTNSNDPYSYSGEPTRAIYYVIPTMRGDDVKWVQAALNAYGNYGLAIDGSFGPACKEATAKFQASMGLAQDGSFGPATRAAMVNWLNGGTQQPAEQPQLDSQPPQQTTNIADNPYNYSSAPARAIYYVLPTMRGNDVKWVQAALNAYGNYGLALDGSFGPACRTATQQFQASVGLAQDGSFGPATRAKMVEWLNSQGCTSGNGSAANTVTENNGLEYAIFPMQYLNITQGVNESYSHPNRLAIDIAGKDSGQDAFNAPFTGTVKRIYGSDHVVWFESNNPVQFANGVQDYMTIMCMHDNDISDLYVGKVINQGEPFLTEGTAGNATGNHIHLEIGRGKFSGTGWYQNISGKWCINNGINPWDGMYITSSTIVTNGYGYNWRIIN